MARDESRKNLPNETLQQPSHVKAGPIAPKHDTPNNNPNKMIGSPRLTIRDVTRVVEFGGSTTLHSHNGSRADRIPARITRGVNTNDGWFSHRPPRSRIVLMGYSSPPFLGSGLLLLRSLDPRVLVLAVPTGRLAQEKFPRHDRKMRGLLEPLIEKP